jgi:hypothetical protein
VEDSAVSSFVQQGKVMAVKYRFILGAFMWKIKTTPEIKYKHAYKIIFAEFNCVQKLYIIW